MSLFIYPIRALRNIRPASNALPLHKKIQPDYYYVKLNETVDAVRSGTYDVLLPGHAVRFLHHAVRQLRTSISGDPVRRPLAGLALCLTFVSIPVTTLADGDKGRSYDIRRDVMRYEQHEEHGRDLPYGERMREDGKALAERAREADKARVEQAREGEKARAEQMREHHKRDDERRRDADHRERELGKEFYKRESERTRESYKGYEENMREADKARAEHMREADKARDEYMRERYKR